MNMFSFRIHSLLENVNNLSIFSSEIMHVFPYAQFCGYFFVHLAMAKQKTGFIRISLNPDKTGFP